MIVSQRALFRPKARALAAWLGAGARVLEVGCFVGGFLREARDVGLIAAGLDPSEQLAILCRRSGLRVVGSTLESLATSARAERYDVVAIWNTFDQLPRPRAALAAALRVLQPGGMVIVRTPHGRYFRERVANGRAPRRALAWNNLLGFPYLHGYGLESIDRLALEFGLVRTRSVGDTLGTVADRTYSPWARLEERALKAAQRRALARDPLQAPWLDVYLRDARLARISHLPESAGQSRSAGF
jgi:SAM-dependent methyltransferase